MNEDLLKTIPIYIVWYEDRFGFGEDRDEAYIVTFFPSQEEADEYINTHEGPIDTAAGKFDGLFTQQWTAAEALKAGLISKEDLQKVLRV